MSQKSTLYSLTEIVRRKLLPVSIYTLRRLIRAGRLNSVNLGGGKVPRYSVTHAEVHRFLKRSRTKTAG